MRIVSPRGGEISTMVHWAELHSKGRWTKGRSAHSIADFVLNRHGAAHLEARLSNALEREVTICLLTPEKEVRFDGYRGRGRTHDVGIQASASGGLKVFAGLEAKVDEKFGPSMEGRLKDARKELVKNPRSRAVDRIQNLPSWFSPGLHIDSMLDIRYQLVHGTAGTVGACQANGESYDLYVFYVLVFKTTLYDEQAGEENHRDYLRFISRVGGSELESSNIEAHLITVNKKPLICIYEQIEMSSVAS